MVMLRSLYAKNGFDFDIPRPGDQTKRHLPPTDRKPPPVGEAIAQRSVGGVLGLSIAGRAIGLSLPPPSASPTPPPQGEALGRHSFALSRGNPLRVWGGGGALRAMPGKCSVWRTVFGLGRSAPRGRWTEAFGSRIFNPLRWRPPAGGELANPPDRAGDFSPRLVRVVFRPRGRPAVRSDPCYVPSEDPTLRPTRRAPRHRPTDASRSTAPHRPSGRQLDGLPSGGARRSLGRVSIAEDQMASRFFKALISLESKAVHQRVDLNLSPPRASWDPIPDSPAAGPWRP